MKKLFLTLPAVLLATAAFCDPVSDLRAGTDLALRCTSGKYTVAAFGASNDNVFLSAALVHIPKAAGGLVASCPAGTLLPHLGIDTNLTLTGGTSSATNGITWTVSDPTLIGKTINVSYNGALYPVVVRSVGGSLSTVASFVNQPVLDPFDHVYRATQIVSDTANPGTITITGTTADGTDPVTLTLHPDFAGIGGAAGSQFVLDLSVGTNNGINLFSGVTYFGTVYLEHPAEQDTAVVVSGPLFHDITPVVVHAGKSSATFDFTANDVSSLLPAWLTATAAGHSFTKALNVLPLLGTVTFYSLPIVSGSVVGLQVTLNGPAPTGGIVVKIHSDNPNVVLPDSVTVPQGEYSAYLIGTSTVVPTAATPSGITYTYVEAIYGSTIVRTSIPLN